MDSTLALALMMKARTVFERDGDVLCFPVSPMSYPSGYLDFLAETPIDVAKLEDFSNTFNMVPDDILWPPTNPTFLWDAYRDVLQQAILANSSRTPEEQSQYLAAQSVLFSTDATGLKTPTAEILAYDRYRDAYIVAEQNERAVTPPVPALQQALADALSAWETQGFKSQIESASATVARLGEKSPELEWAAWNANCDPNTAAMTDATGNDFYPTAFSPVDLFAPDTTWQSFTIAGPEADALRADAPESLRARLAGATDIAIDHVSLEYTSVVVKRAWFDPSLFARQYWKLPAPGDIVSDGQSLTSGSCPAYVVALVFARNVQVTLASDPVRNAALDARLRAGQPVDLGFFQIEPVAQTANGQLHFTTVPQPFVSVHSATPIRRFPVMHPMARMQMGMASGMTAAIAPAEGPAMQAMLQQRLITRAPFHPMPITLPPIVFHPAPVTPQPPQPTPPPAAAVDDTVYVLGLICRHVPASPHPDSTLSW